MKPKASDSERHDCSTGKRQPSIDLRLGELSADRLATLACLLEVTAPKPGNVHRGADFEDVTFADFQVSAVVMGNAFADVGQSLGQMVLRAVKATRAAVGSNTNLGLILLLAPLVRARQVGASQLNAGAIDEVLSQLTPTDGRDVFDAIALAKPGGMGVANKLDIHSEADEVDLLAAMQLAQDRDSVAFQYAHNFETIFEMGVPFLKAGLAAFGRWDPAIVFAHLALMATIPDTLIARKCGTAMATESSDRAAECLAQWFQRPAKELTPDVLKTALPQPESVAERFWDSVGELDFWLRSDGHQRNPGTTADLIGATIFVALCEQEIAVDQPIFNEGNGNA